MPRFSLSGSEFYSALINWPSALTVESRRSGLSIFDESGFFEDSFFRDAGFLAAFFLASISWGVGSNVARGTKFVVSVVPGSADFFRASSFWRNSSSSYRVLFVLRLWRWSSNKIIRSSHIDNTNISLFLLLDSLIRKFKLYFLYQVLKLFSKKRLRFS